MFNLIKTGVAVLSLSLSLCSFAQSCLNESCGVDFTSVPTVPTLVIGTSTTATYIVTNQGFSNTVVSYDLFAQDSLNDPAAVTIDRSSTCPNAGLLNSGSSCNIVLSFQPTVSGSLEWDLTVRTPLSTQAPTVQTISTDVVTNTLGMYVVNSGVAESNSPSIIRCPMNSDGSFGSDATPSTTCEEVTLTFGGSETMNAPWGIVFWTSSASTRYAFISNSGNDEVTICPVIDDLTFGSVDTPCVNSTGPDGSSDPTFSAPTTLAISNVTAKLYVTNSTGPSLSTEGSISLCEISDTDASLGNCTLTDAGTSPHGFSLYTDQNMAFASNSTNPGAILAYDVDGDGALTYNSTFTDSNNTLESPMSVVVGHGDGGAIVLYLTDMDNDSLSVCPLDGSNLPTPCSVISLTGVLFSPINMVGTSVGAFFANLEANSGAYSVVFCGMSSCITNVDPLLNSPIGLWIDN